jgi:hypothetical protein
MDDLDFLSESECLTLDEVTIGEIQETPYKASGFFIRFEAVCCFFKNRALHSAPEFIPNLQPYHLGLCYNE